MGLTGVVLVVAFAGVEVVFLYAVVLEKVSNVAGTCGCVVAGIAGVVLIT